MKKALFVIAILFVFAGVAMAATPTATANPVPITANVPDWLSLGNANVPSVVFNFTPGSTTAQASAEPVYSLAYNLAKGEHVVVCAYLDGALQGSNAASDKITPDEILVVGGGENQSGSFFTGTCGGFPHAVKIDDGTGYNAGTNEQLILGIISGAIPPVPDTYTGNLNVMAAIY